MLRWIGDLSYEQRFFAKVLELENQFDFEIVLHEENVEEQL